MSENVELTVQVTLNLWNSVVNKNGAACEWGNNTHQIPVARTLAECQISINPFKSQQSDYIKIGHLNATWTIK